ncbi:MAG: protease modulator HflC [Phycisphaerae bacterium]
MAKPRTRSGKVATMLLVVLVIATLLAWMVTFKVEFTEHVLVQTFGKTTRVLSGGSDAGLHFKWPFVQRIVRYDARTFVFEDMMSELQTNDTQDITLTTFCAWRIVDPVRFQTNIRTVKEAQEGIRSKLQSAKKQVIGDRKMEELVNTDPKRMRIAEIEGAILGQIAEESKEHYGVEIVKVGIKTLGLPESVSDKVIQAMKDERQKEAGRYETAGRAEAMAITERAKEASEQILAFANRKASEIRAQGDQAAADEYGKFGEDWQLAAFLRSLESLKKELQGRTIFLLDGSVVPGAGYFRNGPSLPPKAPTVGPEAKGEKPAAK